MREFLNALVTSLAGSPWAYLGIFLVVAIDAFFPVVPGEAFAVAGGVAAASGEQSVLPVIAAAAAGAFAGDHVPYAIGRLVGVPTGYLARSRRAAGIYSRAQRALRTRGGTAIVAMRFVPGGRTATTMLAGTLRYPLTRFAAFDALAAVLSASYVVMLGYWVGDVLAGKPLTAVLAGLAISAFLAAAAEGLRVARQRRAPAGRGGEPAEIEAVS